MTTVTERKIYNPIQKDYVTFLKTAGDTNGECTLVEVELADGGGVGDFAPGAPQTAKEALVSP